MRLIKPTLIVFIAFALMPFTLPGQAPVPDSLSVRMLAHATGSSIILRWAPLDYETWEWGNQHGYRLERVTIRQNGAYLTYSEQEQSFVVLDSTLAPLPEAAWQPLADADDLAGLAAGAIHGQGFMVDTLSTEGLVEAYNVNQERDNRFGFSLFAADQSYTVAEAMGLAYTDAGVAPGAIYVYRVRPNNVPAGTVLEKGRVSAGTDETEAFPQPNGLTAFPGDRQVRLSWERTGSGEFYTSFIVERSDDGGASFQQVNDKPVIYTTSTGPESNYLFFQDSLPANGQLYVYRVRGHSPFGLPGPASDTVHVVGKPRPVDYTPVIVSMEEQAGGSVQIKWNPAGSLRTQLSGFDVYRSASREGEFVKINSAPVSPFLYFYTDDNALPVNYYVVKAVDINGYVLESFPQLMQLNDETPPAAPKDLECAAAANGIVQLRWAPNSEEDLMGYRVFTANQLDGEYAQLTDTWIRDTAFYHQLNLMTLSEDVYFKVLALDYRENQSALSAACEVQRPDIIPPAPPNISEVESTMEGIRLAWQESPSEDVEKYELHRRKVSGYSWDILESWGPGELSSFVDTTASYEFEYEYRLMAIDDAGLRSSSKPIRAQPLDDGIRAPVANLWVMPGHRTNLPQGGGQYIIWNNGDYAVHSGQTVPRGAAVLVWEYPDSPGLHSFLIYRAARDGQFRAHKTVLPENAFIESDRLMEYIALFGENASINLSGTIKTYLFVDEDLRGGQSYQYKVMARYIDGAVSPMSGAVVIVF
ncbi:MAG: fibronectin type III domain-containing protein [Phaeodactylibacter sp.]|nr:fibronectin type III domain-containing protein [Phaeodactylibacter sp.]